MASLSILTILFILPFLFGILQSASNAETDTLKPGQQLRDWEPLVSAGGVFRLGFFTPDKTPKFELGSAGPRYIGIWFNRIPYFSVWVANPKNPVPDSSGALTIDTNGIMKITHIMGSPIVVNPGTRFSLAGNVSATLLDNGNFVVRQASGRVLWQSFDYPSNILLPGMKIGFDLKTGQERSVTSWLSDQVPAPGAFRLGLDPSGADQLLIWRRGEVYWSSGIWKNGTSKLSLEVSREYLDYEFNFHSDKYRRYFSYNIKESNESALSWWSLDILGEITVSSLIQDRDSSTQTFDTSGPCTTSLKNESAVCISEKTSPCRKGSEYFKPRRGFMDQFGYGDYNTSLGLSDCHASCWKNCSCVAFQTSSFDGTGCQFWSKGAKFFAAETSDQLLYVLDSGKN